MSFYLDASVLVRVVAGQPRPLRGWESMVAPVASVVIEVETPRAIDRLRRAGALSDDQSAAAAGRSREALRTLRLVELDPAVRLRAGGPFAVDLRTMDAIHLATALLWREAHPDEELVFATHDERLAKAALAHGLEVIGWPE